MSFSLTSLQSAALTATKSPVDARTSTRDSRRLLRFLFEASHPRISGPSDTWHPKLSRTSHIRMESTGGHWDA